jgi:hypothetical protein
MFLRLTFLSLQTVERQWKLSHQIPNNYILIYISNFNFVKLSHCEVQVVTVIVRQT